jgi:hypothetical protein
VIGEPERGTSGRQNVQRLPSANDDVRGGGVKVGHDDPSPLSRQLSPIAIQLLPRRKAREAG